MTCQTQLICRITKDGTFESASSVKSKTEAMFALDKNYGYMKNDGIITYSIENDDQEITLEETEKAMMIACYEWSLDTNIEFIPIRQYRETHPGAEPMIRVIFRDESEDEILNPSTIAYMGYPMNGNVFYGLLVLNKRYVFSIAGNPISGHEMQKLGLKVQFLDGKYTTMDLDKIFRHEIGHGVYGLPHSMNRDVTMSSNESFMAEHNQPEDIKRAQKKAGKSKLLPKWRKLIKKWFHI